MTAAFQAGRARRRAVTNESFAEMHAAHGRYANAIADEAAAMIAWLECVDALLFWVRRDPIACHFCKRVRPVVFVWLYDWDGVPVPLCRDPYDCQEHGGDLPWWREKARVAL